MERCWVRVTDLLRHTWDVKTVSSVNILAFYIDSERKRNALASKKSRPLIPGYSHVLKLTIFQIKKSAHKWVSYSKQWWISFPCVIMKIFWKILIIVRYSTRCLLKRERERTMGCLLHWSPKFYNNVFLFVG